MIAFLSVGASWRASIQSRLEPMERCFEFVCKPAFRHHDGGEESIYGCIPRLRAVHPVAR